jgi:hypothetical protein
MGFTNETLWLVTKPNLKTSKTMKGITMPSWAADPPSAHQRAGMAIRSHFQTRSAQDKSATRITKEKSALFIDNSGFGRGHPLRLRVRIFEMTPCSFAIHISEEGSIFIDNSGFGRGHPLRLRVRTFCENALFMYF